MGFMVGKKYEAGGIAKDGAKMVMAVANAQVGVHSSQWQAVQAFEGTDLSSLQKCAVLDVPRSRVAFESTL